MHGGGLANFNTATSFFALEASCKTERVSQLTFQVRAFTFNSPNHAKVISAVHR